MFFYSFSFIALCLFYKFNKNTVWDIAVSIIFIISYYYSRMVISVFIFFIFAKYVSFDSILKAFILTTIICILFTVFSSIFELYEYQSMDTMYRSNGLFRDPLGYKYPTYIANMSLYLYMAWSAIRKEKLGILELLFFFLMNIYVYVYTDTRTIFYLVNFFICCILFIKLFNINYKTIFIGRILAWISSFGFILLSTISIYLIITYDPNIEWMYKLNKILSGRLYYGNKGFLEYGISFLGQKVEYIDIADLNSNNSLFVIDSGYFRALIDYGVVLFSVIALGFKYVGDMIVKENNIYYGIIFGVIMLDLLVNPHIMSLDFNPFIFLLSYVGKYRSNMCIEK
ncbi:hypothetical protein C8D76_101294 [Pasteurella langaaensis DSM 22999]|uniref:Uncharacterized protein n=1 Tax=Alitibacter langaaensis DSM 22999 TaxID=1122935 RepID=A0A2U0TH63_9PAST|nr:hypothetical protein [Pasteurella langaaensis]PVX42955.1 hypothetical protein C8D76_101294 [Pasteurella langaaensis DSM 22999]